MASLSKQGSAMLSSFLNVVGGSDQNLSGSEFAGTWEVRDSKDTPFEITLFGSGTAEANRAGEGMTGTWSVDGPADGATAVITWDTGWTTKITHMADGYVKTAYDQTAATPTNTSTAQKVD
ncbi:hypothetical protein [Hyphomicrobium sp.]|uniref:hypothetical protein n=1 Tax=Hyphomicrobium sp. TaxID=82 RepID=UPI003F72068B